MATTPLPKPTTPAAVNKNLNVVLSILKYLIPVAAVIASNWIHSIQAQQALGESVNIAEGTLNSIPTQ